MVLCLLGGGGEGVCAALQGDVGYGVVFVRRSEGVCRSTGVCAALQGDVGYDVVFVRRRG